MTRPLSSLGRTGLREALLAGAERSLVVYRQYARLGGPAEHEVALAEHQRLVHDLAAGKPVVVDGWTLLAALSDVGAPTDAVYAATGEPTLYTVDANGNWEVPNVAPLCARVPSSGPFGPGYTDAATGRRRR